jgi:Gelsolin repeat
LSSAAKEAMSDSSDVPVLARVYKSTVQRIPCDLRQFNSNAAFILACENIRKIYVWIGKVSSPEDAALAETVAFDILRDDYLNIGELETIKEDQEQLQSLDLMLGRLFMKIDDYRQQAPFRSGSIENSPITLSVVERRRTEGPDVEYALNPVSHSAVSRTGSVPPLPFLSVVDRKTIAVLTTGNQYDIW